MQEEPQGADCPPRGTELRSAERAGRSSDLPFRSEEHTVPTEEDASRSARRTLILRRGPRAPWSRRLARRIPKPAESGDGFASQ